MGKFWGYLGGVIAMGLLIMGLGPCSVNPLPKAVPESATIPVETYRVVQTYPHDPAAFTQGLVYDQGQLYEGTGLWRRSSVRQVALATGQVQRQHNLAAHYFGEGITLWQGHLLQLTWRSQIGFIYDAATFEPTGNFQYPTEGWGLTHDGQRLIMSDGSDRLYFLDPANFAPLGELPVRAGDRPIERLNELEYIHGAIFANIWQSDRIARISPQTGQVTGWIDLTGLNPYLENGRVTNPDAVLNGIAYDEKGDRLFVTGKLWPQLFEIELIAKPEAAST